MSIETFTRQEFEREVIGHVWHDTPAGSLPCRVDDLGLVDGEHAYLVRLPNGAAVHVRSSVGPSGWSDDSGQNSIRCWIVDADTGEPLCSKVCKWTTRLPGWAGRTRDVIRRLAKLALRIRECPR